LGESVRVFSLWSVAVDPIGDQIQFCLREPLIILKIPEPLDGPPGWHTSRKHGFLNLNCPRLHILISHQRERRSAFTVTRCAALINDSGVLSIPRDRVTD